MHEEYGVFLTAMGRLDEAQRHSSEAIRLDPLSVYPARNLAIIALVQHRFEDAAAGFRRTVAIDPDWTWGYIKLSRALALEKRCPEAFEQAEVGERRIAGGAAPLSRSWLGATYALCGDRRRAQQKLDELTALQKTQYVDPVTFAGIYAALGEVDEALQWFERAYQDRTPNMVYANLPGVNPAVNADPRYQAIVARMGFPKTNTAGRPTG